MEQIKKLLIVLILITFTGLAYSQITPVKIDLYSNGNKLNADFYQAKADTLIPTFILLHGYGGSEGDPLGMGKRLSSSGINVLIFNYQGTASSQGEFSFENSMEDIGAAIMFLKKHENIERFNIDSSNIVVGGWSFGGAMALTAAIYNTDIKRIISISGADESVFVRKMLTDPNFRIMFEQMLKESKYPKGRVKLNVESSIKHVISNVDNYDLLKHSESLENRDILFLGGWKDQNVILEEHILPLYRKLQELNEEELQIQVFDTDHGFGNVREELGDTIEKWIKKRK